MTPQEANKIIAEYMGCIDFNSEGTPIEDRGTFWCEINYLSLDALVPVWEKIKQIPLFNQTGEANDPKWLCEIECENSNPKFNYVSGHAITIQEAACIATARAIKELK